MRPATMIAATIVVTIGCTASACRPRASRADAGAGAPLDLTWTLDRQPAGRAALTVTLRESSGAPVVGAPVIGATVRVEGHMTHPGMTPIVATATPSDREPGVYHTDLAFTMAGDWALLVSASLPDGRRVERRIDVTNVQLTP